MKTKQWALALILAAAMGAASARSAPMVQPERVLLPATQAQSQGAQGVRAAIVAGSQSLGWTVARDEPGKLTLKYNKQGKHEAVVDAVYDEQGYQLQYVDSTNLNYASRSGGAEIHPNYNRWIANLIRSIGLAAK